ncbi:MAG: acyltransferase [Clostridiales bacterium]|nr:acyltransferase [Clostridiales bacterium]
MEKAELGKTNRNVKLNLLKGIACIGVVFIHITPPGLFGDILVYGFQFAVPIFLMIAGFYAYGKEEDVIKRRLIKIVKIFLYAYLVFFLYKLAFSLKDHELNKWLSESYKWDTPIKYICFCTINFAVPLWYLIAMIETYIVWLFVVKGKKEDVAIKLTPILFLFQIILTAYCETNHLKWFWKINFLAQALPWFMLGYFLHTEKAQKVREIKTSILALLAMAGFMIEIMPSVFDLSLKFNVVGYLPCTFGLFCLALKNPEKSICKPLEFLGDKLSLNVYILHVPISGIIGLVASDVFSVNIKSKSFLWVRPSIVLLVTILVSWVIYEIKTSVRKNRNSLTEELK